jgi:hypothetical protein
VRAVTTERTASTPLDTRSGESMNGRIVFPSGAWGTVGRAPYVPRQCHDHAADAPDTPDSTPSTPAIQRGRTFATRRSAKTTLITNLLTNQCARRRTCRHICAHLPRSERANHSSPLSMAWKWSGFESLSSTIGFSLERAARRREGVCRSGWRRGSCEIVCAAGQRTADSWAIRRELLPTSFAHSSALEPGAAALRA